MTKQYQVLARRYRPQRFSDVVGQEAVLQTLKNALRRGSLAHAYLFSGSRGIGKTTLARLFAKALNCTSIQPDEEPCNHCPSCLDILSGQSLDVIEIDGASNRGIDDIRQINETVGFAPSHGKYKIYIIDEVHMLTKEAFNALLKTLEEPPERAKFFFATTEPHKVLPTILSRCQRFDLGRLSSLQIIAKLESIAKDLQRKIDSEAIHLIAQHADGSLRDAESLLDQILCFAAVPQDRQDDQITAQDVRNALGLVSQDLFFALDQAFAEERLAASFELVDELFSSGKDLAYFLEQLIEHYRHIAVAKTRGETALGFPPPLAARYAAAASLYSQPQCLAILDLLLKADAQISRSASPRIALELTLLQVLRTKNRISIETLIRRLSEIEEKIINTQPPHIDVERAAPCNPVSSEPIPTTDLSNSKQEPFASLRSGETKTSPSAPSIDDKIELKAVPFNPYQVNGQLTAQSRPSAVESTELSARSAKELVPPFPSGVKLAPPLAEKPPLSTASAIRPSPLQNPPAPSKHPSHYATLMRFAAVELEGTIKN